MRVINSQTAQREKGRRTNDFEYKGGWVPRYVYVETNNGFNPSEATSSSKQIVQKAHGASKCKDKADTTE